MASLVSGRAHTSPLQIWELIPKTWELNPTAELMKITSCADARSWKLLVDNGPALIKTRFGRADGSDPELKKIADEITYRGIKVMLDVRIMLLIRVSVRTLSLAFL